jgi:hypothetical protein
LLHAEQLVVGLAGDGFELGGLPAEDVFGGGVGDDGLEFGAGGLDVGVFGDVELEGFGEDDGGGGDGEEVFGTPEVVGGFGFGADDMELVLEVVAFAEAADGNLVFFEIAVEGGFAGDGSGKLLGVGCGGGDDGAVGAAAKGMGRTLQALTAAWSWMATRPVTSRLPVPSAA